MEITNEKDFKIALMECTRYMCLTGSSSLKMIVDKVLIKLSIEKK